MASDKDYKANQCDAQKRWCSKNQDYWRRYRDAHPDYVQRNRQLQRVRNARRSAGTRKRHPIAKRYALTEKKGNISGYYKLIPADGRLIAKSDVSLVRLELISVGYAHGR